jgi:hypothetical protein
MTPFHEEINELHSYLETYSLKYGYYSVTSLVIKYNILISILKMFINLNNESDKAALSAQLEKATIILQDHYDKTSRIILVEHNFHIIKEYLKKQKTLLEYDYNYYIKHYQPTAQKVQNETYTLKGDYSHSHHIISDNVYIYIVDKYGELIIYQQPISIIDLVFRKEFKSNQGYSLIHPYLVKTKDIIIQGAGEIIFVKNNSKEIKGCVVNNKSGHFMPPESTLQNVNMALKDTFKNNITIINIAIKKF